MLYQLIPCSISVRTAPCSPDPPPLRVPSLRRRTWRALDAVPAGQLGALMSVVASDRLGPLLTPPHLAALSRRHRVLREVVRWCQQHHGRATGHAVLVGD